jgi:inosine-uridine nucleoside N-ribohydrolase
MNIWLDLELRKDIDDIITLLIALNNHKKSIKIISINNPSINELKLLNSLIIKKYNSENKPKIIISGEITEYKDEEDVNKVFLSLIEEKIIIDYIKLEEFLKQSNNLKEYIYFNGGSLYNLSKILEKEEEITAYIQGGYVGNNIIPKEIALKKFEKREAVPSWNLNLDENATYKILNSKKANLYFISKNICHSAIITFEDISMLETEIADLLYKYFKIQKEKNRKKAMHDVLAYFAIFFKSIIEFKEVELKQIKNKNKRTTYKSEINKKSNIKISINYDYKKFKSLFLKSILDKKETKNDRNNKKINRNIHS